MFAGQSMECYVKYYQFLDGNTCQTFSQKNALRIQRLDPDPEYFAVAGACTNSGHNQSTSLLSCQLAI